MLEKLNEKLKNIKISEENKKIKIEIIKEGWITELYIILQVLNKNKDIEIKGVFQVYKEDRMVIKEILEEKEKVLKCDYKNFINLIKSENNKSKLGSGKIEWNKINQIEIRLWKKIKNNKELGFNETYMNLIREIIPIEIS